MRRGLALSLLVTASLLAASPTQAWATHFHRGDMFLSGTSGVREYTPSGHLVQTIPGTSGVTAECFDPSGAYLILPGAGLFDRSGKLLPSNWATDASGGSCVADGMGNVYVDNPTFYPPHPSAWTVTKYDISGNPLQTFTLETGQAIPGFAIDLASDGCTLDYGDYYTDAGQFNVCTDTQGQFSGSTVKEIDDLRILPNGEVLRASDEAATLSSGLFASVLRSYSPPSSDVDTQSLRTLSLDPDGTSFWACCEPLASNGAPQIMRFDINSGALLTQWTAPSMFSRVAVDPGKRRRLHHT